MMIRTPKFWLTKNIIAILLWPLSLIYQMFSWFGGFCRKQNKIAKKVICIGNITVGGSGKTPVALMIGTLLQEIGVEFAYLSRGHRGKIREVRQVDIKDCQASEVGDEPLILAELAPTFVAKDRFVGAKIIEKNPNFQAIVLDDGMQNNSIKKDFTILVIDGKVKFGNGFIFPAGPLRQSIQSGLKQADLVVVIGEIDANLQKILSRIKFIQAKIKAKNLAQFQDQKLVAFCGIAYPEKFFSYLQNQGLQTIAQIDFPDHYFYTKSDLEKLQKQAFEHDAKLITTKKDWIKFPQNFKEQIGFLDIELEPENKGLLLDKIKRIIAK